jgi:serine/threonine protein kinase
MPNQLKITFFVLIEQTKNALISKWLMRFKICMGIAGGLTYLHEEVTSRIIHRDIKLKHILFDKKWNLKIADIGMYNYSQMTSPTYLCQNQWWSELGNT